MPAAAPKPLLSEQMSLRITKAHRDFLNHRAAELSEAIQPRQLSEADIIRLLIDREMRKCPTFVPATGEGVDQ